MNVTVNILELASELAENELLNIWDYELDGQIYKTNNFETYYTEKAQDVFNELSDKHYTIIESCIL